MQLLRAVSDHHVPHLGADHPPDLRLHLDHEVLQHVVHVIRAVDGIDPLELRQGADDGGLVLLPDFGIHPGGLFRVLEDLIQGVHGAVPALLLRLLVAVDHPLEGDVLVLVGDDLRAVVPVGDQVVPGIAGHGEDGHGLPDGEGQRGLIPELVPVLGRLDDRVAHEGGDGVGGVGQLGGDDAEIVRREVDAGELLELLRAPVIKIEKHGYSFLIRSFVGVASSVFTERW